MGIKSVYVDEDGTKIRFDKEYVTKIFFTTWENIVTLWWFGRKQGLYADRIFKKLESIKRYVEDYVDKLRIEYTLYSLPNVNPWVEVKFKDDGENEIAHVNIRWHQKELHAYFNGAKEKAKRLASILNALGVETESKKYYKEWYVILSTDSIIAIRRKEWLDAVRALVEELHNRGVINEEQRNKLLADINAGPSIVEIAGVKLSVWEEITDKYKRLVIKYEPRSAKAFDAAVKILKDVGLEEGVHFTAKRPEKGKIGYIYIKMPTGLWRLEELRRHGADWADKTLRRLEEVAKARGFHHLLEEYLKPAREAETVDPNGIVAEITERGIKAVIKSIRIEWEKDRPKIVVEYEVGGEVKSFFFTWGAEGKVRTNVRLNDERAAVLAVLTGDNSIRGKRGNKPLYARHLFALAKYKGVGWELLRWYAEMVKE
ncbi:hypothetical protein CGL51_02145 [Pyrobaculum aerophilum]|uniref:PaRep2b domain-containing protein n=2 Tax=Pyrobaculum aerophilum TaxID=13773 RepID=A0A371R2F8_9CREN|nr:hypothetical protein CGL51_02145 [Pyrobaculum aerophilum]RFA99543.1 hypothetical protein CGL52_02910 [Pyrobaculum aerophilum]